MDEILVSIIIPVYNDSLHISKAINSALEQTYKNIEVIVINDGSTDDTMNVLNSFNDQRLHIIDKENGGVSAARNLGISVANGQYLMFLDSDDYLDQEAVFKLVNIIKDTDIDVIRFNGFIENKKHEFSKLNFGNIKAGLSTKTSKELFDSIISPIGLRCYVWQLFIKKDSLKDFNINLHYLEDTVFYLENFINKNKIYFYDECLYYYVYNISSKTKSLDNIYINFNDILTAYDCIKSIGINYDISIKKLSSYIIRLLMYRLDYYSNYLKYNDFKKLVLYVKNTDTYKNEINNININELSKIKKIQYKLLKSNKLFLYYLITKIKEKIK